MPISSNRRQRVIEFATPKVADLVVVERVDASKNVNSAATADDAADASGNFGAAHPDTTRFPGFKLALIKNGDNDQGQFQDWYYVKDRADQDDYNWEFQAAGASSPRFDTVVRTYVTLRSAFNDASPALASDMPVVSSDAFTEGDGYILFEKKQTRSGDETLDSLYVIEQHIFVRRVTIRTVDADKQFPFSVFNESTPPKVWGGLVSKESLFHKDEFVKATIDFIDSAAGTAGVSNTLYTVNSGDSRKAEFVFSDNEAWYTGVGGEYDTTSRITFWGVDKFGIMREGKQLSDNWYVLSESEVIRKQTTTGLVAEYYTNQNMGWPAVFSNLFATVWNRRDGGKHTNVYPVYLREPYNGPTKVLIQIYWQKEVFLPPTTEAGAVNSAGSTDPSNARLCLLKPMEAAAMEFVTPNWRVKTKPCLHADVTVTYTNGTEDPVWDYGGYKAMWKATNYSTWPTDIVISDSQEPFRGGYLRTKVTAFKPNISTSADADRHLAAGAPAGPEGGADATPDADA